MNKKMVIQNELVKVKGRVKAVIVRKEDFANFLKLTKLRVLDKTYDVLMPPIDGMKKNTIDLNGLALIIQNYLPMLFYNSGSTSSPTPAQIVLTTSSSTPVTLQYSGGVSANSQGVMVLPQIFGTNGNITFQFYFIGFDTTDNSYSATQAELYASAWVNHYRINLLYTPLIRIAYTNISITKSSTEYLFLVWLIEFDNVPSYASFAVPIFQNNLNLIAISNGSYNNNTIITIYFYNGNCNFTCGGNCPGGGLGSFIVYPQNNALVLEFPLQAPLGSGMSSLEVLICTTLLFTNTNNSGVLATISGSESTTVSPPVSGATLYVAIATISITYSVS